jgi:hypothetical protein
MSAEKLKSLVEKGNLINLNIISDSLTALLNEVAVMLVDQQAQLIAMRQQITEKVSREDFTEFKDQWRIDRDIMMRSLPDFDGVVQKLTRDFDVKAIGLRQMVDESVTSVLMSVDNRIAQKMDSITADQMALRQSIAMLEQKIEALAQAPAKVVVAPPPPILEKPVQRPVEFAKVREVPKPAEPVPVPVQVNVPEVVKPVEEVKVEEAPVEEVKAEVVEVAEPGQSESPPTSEQVHAKRPARMSVTAIMPAARASDPVVPVAEEVEGSEKPVALPASAPVSEAVLSVIPDRSPQESAGSSVSTTIAKLDDPEFIARVTKLEEQLAAFVSDGSESLRDTVKREVLEQLQELAPMPMTDVEKEFETIHQYGTLAPPRRPEEFEEIREAIRRLEVALNDQGSDLLGRVQRKAETSLVERMFEKLRGIIASVKDEVNALEVHVEKLVRRTEMEEYVETSLNSLLDDEQAAAANKPLKCLACGRPRLKASTADTYALRQGELPPLSPVKPSKR